MAAFREERLTVSYDRFKIDKLRQEKLLYFFAMLCSTQLHIVLLWSV